MVMTIKILLKCLHSKLLPHLILSLHARTINNLRVTVILFSFVKYVCKICTTVNLDVLYGVF